MGNTQGLNWEEERNNLDEIAKDIREKPNDNAYADWRNHENEHLQQYYNKLASGNKTEVYYRKLDGLSFLNLQKQEAGNVLTVNINYSLIPDDEYLKRIAQEIYRAVPRDGIFLSTGSNEIENEAKLLFPYHIKLNDITIFTKKEIEGVFDKNKK